MTTKNVWLAILGTLVWAIPASADDSPYTATFVRMEVHAVPTVTLTTQQFLTGNKEGKTAVLAGELRIPKPGTEKLPAVVLVHGSGGMGPAYDRWARELNSIGVAVFILDSFSGRGIVSTVSDQSQLDSLAMMVDAYRALAMLSSHSRIDPSRIAVMGFSKGAVAAVYSSNRRFRDLYGPARTEFAAHIGLYTPCNVTYRDDDKLTGKPIRMFHGTSDTYVSVVPCRAYVARLKQAGADAVLTEFPDTHHAYDNFMTKQVTTYPQGQTTRNCLLEESDGGQIVNAKSGAPYSLDDPCVEKGPQVGYNATSHLATVEAVKRFLSQSFGLKQ